MIRTGRPAFHIKACSISFRAANGDIEYYELDKKGDLVKTLQEKKIVPHHIVKFSNSQVNPNQFQNSNYNFNQQQYSQQQQFQFQQFLLQQQYQQQYQQISQQQQQQQQQLGQYQQQNEQPQTELQQNRQQQNEQQQGGQQEQLSLFNTVDDTVEESSSLLFGMDISNDSDSLFFDLDNEVINWI